ncbi:MAG: hypothetical protein MHM6MM_006092 [Cercozoa sp. M6MM]
MLSDAESCPGLTSVESDQFQTEEDLYTSTLTSGSPTRSTIGTEVTSDTDDDRSGSSDRHDEGEAVVTDIYDRNTREIMNELAHDPPTNEQVQQMEALAKFANYAEYTVGQLHETDLRFLRDTDLVLQLMSTGILECTAKPPLTEQEFDRLRTRYVLFLKVKGGALDRPRTPIPSRTERPLLRALYERREALRRNHMFSIVFVRTIVRVRRDKTKEVVEREVSGFIDVEQRLRENEKDFWQKAASCFVPRKSDLSWFAWQFSSASTVLSNDSDNFEVVTLEHPRRGDAVLLQPTESRRTPARVASKLVNQVNVCMSRRRTIGAAVKKIAQPGGTGSNSDSKDKSLDSFAQCVASELAPSIAFKSRRDRRLVHPCTICLNPRAAPFGGF